MSRRRRRVSEDDLGAVLMFGIFVVLIILAVYIHFFAPCGSIGWLPAKDLPSRCFTFTRQ